jgi:hypothetical protein
MATAGCAVLGHGAAAVYRRRSRAGEAGTRMSKKVEGSIRAVSYNLCVSALLQDLQLANTTLANELVRLQSTGGEVCAVVAAAIERTERKHRKLVCSIM